MVIGLEMSLEVWGLDGGGVREEDLEPLLGVGGAAFKRFKLGNQYFDEMTCLFYGQNKSVD